MYLIRHVFTLPQKPVQYIGHVRGVARVAQLLEFPVEVVSQESAADTEQDHYRAFHLYTLDDFREVVERLFLRYALQVIIAAQKHDDHFRLVSIKLGQPGKATRSGIAAHPQIDYGLADLLREERDEIAAGRGADADYEAIAEGNDVGAARRIVAHLVGTKKIPVRAEANECSCKYSDDVPCAHGMPRLFRLRPFSRP